MEKKNKVTVKINGQDYPIAGAEPKDYLLKVGSFVDEQMDEVAKHNNKLSTSMIAVLTSINIADQFLKLQAHVDTVKREHTDPLNELEELKDQYTFVARELEEKKEGLQFLQNQVEELISYKERLEAERIDLEEKLISKEEDLSKAETIINDLQNKLFENQIKLVQLRKDLEEYVNTTEVTSKIKSHKHK
ncbi:cell division protein ZapA [Natronincola ferrireducens]|uniref:Cell division protein ZapA n=1 Tax=Natronincola ferrireducens TaxID=393762 RepID=A0A1G9EGC2_9FIRM|nr:cell division protein ZapA [Natronincola ferrireducens]SDK75199.1 cell division protein ZapA [Natronincola ferrireducens]